MKILRTAALTLLLALTAAAAFAQTDPCVASTGTQSIRSGSHGMTWTWSQQDTGGNTALATAWSVTINGSVYAVTPTAGTVCPSGDTPYSVAALPFSKGTYLVTVTVVTVDGSAVSPALSLTVTGAPPRSPNTPKVVQSFYVTVNEG